MYLAKAMQNSFLLKIKRNLGVMDFSYPTQQIRYYPVFKPEGQQIGLLVIQESNL